MTTIAWNVRLGRRHVEAVLAALLPIAVWLLYRKVLRLFWTYDDAYLLHIAATHSPRQYFADSNLWQGMPNRLFTPLLMVVYDTELSLFGLSARGYYVVQVALIALATLALYATLRLYMPRRYGFSGALLFVAGVPLCTLATELMVVHYAVAMLLGIGAAALYILSIRSTPQPMPVARDGIIDILPEGEVRAKWVRAVLLSLASAFLYLLAMLAKEVAVPLVLALPMLPDRDLRTRLRHAVPHALALVVYLVWRTRMLGELLGGYGWAITPRELPRLALTLPFSIIRVFAGPESAGALLIAVTGLGILGLRKRRKGLAMALAALALSIYPVLPVSKEIQPRFAIVAWLCWSVLFIAGTWTLRQHGARISTAALIVAAVVLGLIVNRQGFRQVFNASREMSDEARFFVDAPPDALLRRPAIAPGSTVELQWLKSDALHHAAGALCVYDDVYLCSGRAGRRIFGYDEGRREVRDITAEADADAARFCGEIRPDTALQAAFSYRDGTLFWKLGPYEEGKYRFVLANGLQAYDVAATDGFRLGNLPGIAFRIRYDSPAGWTTYSPELTLDFKRQPELRWSRPGRTE